ncbi:transcription termination factor MTERF5, chloroplastic-like [Prosopis cineraria]|uniref:transcription termination factor MTERF5, chloroplastic-like n=1 Tax=Prosopis cineraria TaxID=364024 RepID=UPI00240FCEB0|nr:transcription termination factor MTERF5, chloroplastic-like [Prosopis cineraria]
MKSSEKPDFVLSLFRKCGFSNSQIRNIIKKAPRLLLSDPGMTIWPKLDFLLSKGASSSQLVDIVTRSPRILFRSLENRLIPSYNFVKGFVGSDQRTITSIRRSHRIMYCNFLETNIQLLLDVGVPKSGIAGLLHAWPSLCTMNLDKFRVAVEGVKERGFDPSKSKFIPALYATNKLSKSIWIRKVEFYKKWGWSEEEIDKAFALHPHCMLKSESKIKAVMEFFVHDMGWDSCVLANNPIFFSMSLEKRIIPRAHVLRYIHSRGLIKNACIVYPYYITENIFLERYVNRFDDESPQLLKLYQETMNRSKKT